MNSKRKTKDETVVKAPIVYGDPEYTAEEDIYSKANKVVFREEGDEFDTENVPEENKLPGEDLDVPGSELDDADEKTGQEDEENNYYSLGGDNHDDLEEDKA
jgi:hypothetical protein